MAGIILSVDIGTSSLKAALIDFSGKARAFARAAYRPDSKGAVSAAAWEEAFSRALEQLRAPASGDSAPDAVCISGNGPTLVPVTHDGGALPPLYWHGGKAALPAGTFNEKSALSFFLPYAAHFKKLSSRDYARTELFVSSHEWLAARLGADFFTALPSPSYEPYYWNDDQCFLYGIEKEKFPPFIKMGEEAGKVSSEAASRFAARSRSGGILKSGLPIISGGPDFITALIGTGIFKAGEVCDRAGSSEGINFSLSEPLETKRFTADNIRVLPHVKEGLWNVGAVIASSGRFFDRYRAFTRQEERSYEEQLRELIPASDDVKNFEEPFLFPHLMAEDKALERFESSRTQKGPEEKRICMGRAVLCAVGFSVRTAITSLKARGLSFDEMKVSGGQGKNPRWNQLKADITGVSLRIPEISDGELAGNAVLAAAALESTRPEESAARMIRFREVYKPRNSAASFWEERWRLYREEAENKLNTRIV